MPCARGARGDHEGSEPNRCSASGQLRPVASGQHPRVWSCLTDSPSSSSSSRPFSPSPFHLVALWRVPPFFCSPRARRLPPPLASSSLSRRVALNARQVGRLPTPWPCSSGRLRAPVPRTAHPRGHPYPPRRPAIYSRSPALPSYPSASSTSQTPPSYLPEL